ncbi:MAG: methionyl-tRNA formyltransferase, partial [Caldilineae bacterium]
RANVLELPRYGCINVHASLLPRWRGASPINAAILAGDPITGSTIMLMDEGMDTGPILAQAAEVIRPDDTAGSLSDRLARQGAELLLNVLPCYLAGKLKPRPQDHEHASKCTLLKKEHARMDWSRPAAFLERMVRAYDPWPGAFTTWSGQMLKVGKALVVEGEAPVGRVIEHEGRPAVGTGQGLLVLEQVQLAGKRMMSVQDFLRGRPDFIGASLGT